MRIVHYADNSHEILSWFLWKMKQEQFLVLKKNIWAWQSMEHDHLNKLSITFQQKDQCEIWWKMDGHTDGQQTKSDQIAHPEQSSGELKKIFQSILCWGCD